MSLVINIKYNHVLMNTEPSTIQSKATFILTVTSLFLLLALIHLLSIFLHSKY